MTIKQPPCYDTSHWRTIPDFALVSPRPLLVLTKATEDIDFVDDTFVRYFADLKQDGIHRGTFHFHRKSFPPLDQARHFCDTIAPHLLPKDILALDVEEGGETAAQLMTFCQYVEQRFPLHLFVIYSRKNILDAIAMTQAQKDYFKRIPIWTAGYPLFPDLYSTVPSSYIPDQTKWGPVYLWQYTDKGQVAGVVEVDTDCNWMSPVLIALLGAPPTPADMITTPRAGMQRISGVRHGWKFELFISDPAKVDFESVCCSPLETVSSVVARKGATLGVNGGEWDRVSQTKDYTVSNHNVCKARVEAVPSLQIVHFVDHHYVNINHVTLDEIDHALSGLRYLIRLGVIQSYLSGTEPQYTEGHARSVHGVNAQGHHMVMQSRGVYPNQGLTLKQCAEIMKQYGAVTAFDSGGGGDVTCIFEGESLIVPENPNGAERYLPNVFLVYAQESTMNGTAKENGGRIGKIRSTPSRYGTQVSTSPAYATIEFVSTVPSIDTGDFASDVWFLLPSGNYLNYIISGQEYFTILTQPSTEPPPDPTPTGNIHIEADLNDDGTITGTWSSI